MKPNVVPADGYDFKDIHDAASVVFTDGGSNYQPPTVTPTPSNVSHRGSPAAATTVYLVSTSSVATFPSSLHTMSLCVL